MTRRYARSQAIAATYGGKRDATRHQSLLRQAGNCHRVLTVTGRTTGCGIIKERRPRTSQTPTPIFGRHQLFASIIIPTCNRPELLARCLDHLSGSLRAAGSQDVEVVVSDDGSDRRTEELVRQRYPWVRWVAGPRGGPAKNRNFGVAQSKGQWIIFTDDDCLPSERWIAAFWDAILGTTRVHAFEGRTVSDRDPQRLDEEAPINESGGYLWACNMAVERDLFERLGGFCELFPHASNEDADFRLRLTKAGEAFTFVPDAVVCHPLRRSKGLRFQLGSTRSFLLLHERHPELLGRAPLRHAVLNFFRRLRITIITAVRLRFRGFGFAIGSLIILTYTELVVALNRRRGTV
jgi:GT2 family glycosyltransferase